MPRSVTMTSINSPGPHRVVTSSTITGMRSRNDGTARIVHLDARQFCHPPMPCSRRPSEWVTTLALKFEIDFGRAKNHGIHHGSKVTLAVIVVRSEGRRRDVPRIARDRAHSVEIEGLPVEDIVGESFFEQFDEIFGGPAAHEAGLYSGLFHQLLQIADKRQSDSARASLE